MSNAAIAFPAVQAVPIQLIDESPFNPRKTFADIEELASDVKRRGILQPVLVRPSPSAADRYELVFGARRLRAAVMAGLDELPAMVRSLSDEEVLETQLVENAKRADIYPMEEAEAYEQLRLKYGHDIEDIAAKVGKSKAYVYARIKLCALVPEARKAFAAGKLNASTALLIARIPVSELQVQATKEITESRFEDDDPMSAREAARHVQDRYMLRLEQAPFDRADGALVAGAGPCTTCAKRTGNQTELFADVKSADVCTDPVCFGKKRDAQWGRMTADAAQKGVTVLSTKESAKVFPYEYSSTPQGEYEDLSSRCYQDPKGRNWKKLLGKECPSVTIARDKNGDIHELVSAKAARAALRKAGHDWAQPAERSPGGGEKAAAKQERALRERTEQLLLERVLAAAEKKLDQAGLLRLVVRDLLDAHCGLDLVEKRRGVTDQQLERAVEKMSLAELGVLVLELLITRNGGYGNDSDCEAAAKLVGVDPKAVEKDAKAALAAEGKAAEKKVAATAPKPKREIVVKKPKKPAAKPTKKSKGKKS